MMDIKLRMSIYRMSTHPVINPRGVACNKKVNNVDVHISILEKSKEMTGILNFNHHSTGMLNIFNLLRIFIIYLM